MSYVPRPDSVADRAIKLLKDLPQGSELTTAQLSAKLGMKSAGLTPFFEKAEAAALLMRRKGGAGQTSKVFWRLGTSADQEAAAKKQLPDPAPDHDDLIDERAADKAARIAHPPTPGPVSLGWIPAKPLYEPPPEFRELATAEDCPAAAPEAPAVVNQQLTTAPAPTSTPEEINIAQREQHLASRAWFSSDGQLVIEAGEHEFVFPRLEARQLVRTIRELGEAWA